MVASTSSAAVAGPQQTRFEAIKPFTQSTELGQVDPGRAEDAGEQITSPPATAAGTLKQRRPWAHFVAGGLGGVTAATLTSPLDVLKTRLQSTFYQEQLSAARTAKGLPAPHQLPFARAAWMHISETGQILAQIPKVEGYRALFKGLGPNLVGVVPARAINFWAYGNGKRVYSQLFFNGQETAGVHLLSAATAGILTGTATNPIWLVKTRLQLDKQNASNPTSSGRQYKNAWDCVKQTVRHEGIRGLYRGLSASYLGVSESTLQWVLYEQAKRSLARRESDLVRSGRTPTLTDRVVQWGGQLTAAGGAKFCAALITYPHEVVRTRLRQAPVDASGRVKYRGLWSCFVTVFREEGMGALYGGLVPHMLRVVPSAAIMFGVYEGVLRSLGESSGV
ncbi:Pyrimidine nucleotide transporter, mitochondrial [Friedmanniomyces endolithicus]|uniref:Pyrimidine nucleotide transporter, mitochondrial n=1 Tax=Friedmanniomyces endolithicus TaxID=329885 RepID=A0AAN6KMB7_9PEZI|nr:Pyrimidine nucleotide transporter, mitochondrial [Friedmanniomyces endolithicus]KAK0783501.1 Pyrimidine nucleotide transporter, mitochondrial [Friedmanniomyces endolithicus]KAK0783941.1 Pyrimidine nucleotide transporter, mitochondrial [Friedmanniomyces endolithicus]KAK0813583.1 Pyrimidine nucleotide transporter, mitochondrial [Friedmanniomyces endolithicus]KAK0848985.1 Pyrimidine nucleotide transporter, mitochondrial [Friedmanniomyces endolithicus]